MNEDGKYHVNFAGANIASFDLPILKRDIKGFSDLINDNRRVLDPSIIFADYAVDEHLPGLSKSLSRAGMDDVVTHDAEDDALQIVDQLEYHRTVLSPLILGMVQKAK
jgi:hypothetical protein